MAEIRVLENSMVNKIAAGEVVERPVSVVKELAENAIDAGATQITVEIVDGGISLIRVTDNGAGIPKDQALSAFLRHATSKIVSMEDLEQVQTMGFRGEALSSIAAVSQVEMTTKVATSETATIIKISGGIVEENREAGAAQGTTFLVRNLFYNVPARRKFLKRPSTEGSYISDLMDKLALGHTHIGFTYIAQGGIVMQTKGSGSLETAILQVYGKEVAKQLIPLKYEAPQLTLTGFLGKLTLNRGNRGYEHFFVNNRYVKSHLVFSAAEEGYRQMLPSSKFPFFVISMNIEPELIDVNVHPTKMEVRFQNDGAIYNAVLKAVSSTIRGQNLIPQAVLSPSSPLPIPLSFPAQKFPSERIYGRQAPITFREEPMEQQPMQQHKQTQLQEHEEQPLRGNYKIIGQIFDTYWVLEQESSMYLVDQHAAHERLLYEDLTEKLRKKTMASQWLLEPFMLKAEASEVILQHIELLHEFGFVLKKQGKQYSLLALPWIMQNPDSPEFFLEIIDELNSTTTGEFNNSREEAIAQIACKAAVKGNAKISLAEAEELIGRIMRLENPFTCPHGRPTIIEITQYELEKKFKRV